MVSAPTSTPDLDRAILSTDESHRFGIYHIQQRLLQPA